jgi:hypothetical protein
MKLYERTNFIHPFSIIFGNKILNHFCNYPLLQLAVTVAVGAAAAAAIIVLKE